MSTILSLFDYTGNWCRPYRDAGYDVVQCDIKLGGWDILHVSVENLPRPVHGILAAPPCTAFSSSGARWWKGKDKDGRTAHALAMVDKVLEIVEHLKPAWWCLENPVGRLRRLRPQLGDPFWFNPCDYGDPYTKKTGLYGSFTPPTPDVIGDGWAVEPDIVCSQGSWVQKLGGKSERTKELRSATPMGFARAFFVANP